MPSDRPRLLFVHIPRCAGMSFYYFLEELYGKDACVRFGDSVSVDRLLQGDGQCDDKDVVSGHVYSGTFKTMLTSVTDCCSLSCADPGSGSTRWRSTL